MKKLLILLGLIPSLLFAAAGDVKISVKNSSNTAWIDTIIAQANSELVGMNSSGTLGGITIGTGLTMVGGTLQASGGVGSGTVVGPGSSTTNAIATYGNTSGTLLVNTGWTISGAALTGPTNGTITNLDSITATAATALTLNAGSGNQNVVLAPTGTGGAAITYATTNNVLQRALSINFDALGSGAPQAAIAVNMATAAEGATVYKMGIGFERTNSFGRGWMNFFNNTTADTSNFAGQNGAGGGGANLGDIVMSLSPLRNVIIGSTADFGSGSYQLKVANGGQFGGNLTVAYSSAKFNLNDTSNTNYGVRSSAGKWIVSNDTASLDVFSLTGSTLATGAATINYTTASTNTSSGALVINNKIGLGGDGSAYFGGTVTSNGTLASGTYSVDISGASGAARSVLRAGIAAVTNGFTVAYDGTNMQYGFAGSGSTTTIGGALGVGSAASSSVGLILRNTLTGSSGQAGISIIPTFGSGTTTIGASADFGFTTATAAFTLSAGVGAHIETPTLGAGSAITTNYGLLVENQTGAGIGTGYAIHTGTGLVSLGDNVSTAGNLTITGTGTNAITGLTTINVAAGTQTLGLNSTASAPTWIQFTSGATVLGSLTRSGNNLVLTGGSAGAALTMDFGDTAASFSGNLSAVAFNGTDSLNLTRATTSANLQTTYTTTTGGNNWTVGLRASDSLLHIYDNTAGKDALTFAASTQAAVFGGNVTFGGIAIHKSYTVAGLPAAASGGVVEITDATNAAGTGLGTVPTGGGTVKRMVYSDGTSWLLL